MPKKYKAPKNPTKSLQDMQVSDAWVGLKPKEIQKLQGDIDGLYEGMGGYGGKTDLVPVLEERTGFAMPQTVKQAKLREERGEKVVAATRGEAA